MMPKHIDETHGWIVPDWPVPSCVKAGSTTRQGGVSQPPYKSLNLGDHVGDDPAAVLKNRQLLKRWQHLPSGPVWLKQVHGVEVVDAARAQENPVADASVSQKPGVVCAVMTADCLPVLLCDQQGRSVAAVHAGWRGLASGIIESAVLQMGVSAQQLFAWLGPAIGPQAFEVGTEVREAFTVHDPQAEAAFKAVDEQHWLADIYHLARLRLKALGVVQIYGGHWCTYNDAEHFYSYRRDGVTGRMASLIWITES